MRAADMEECLIAGFNPEDALKASRANSSWTVLRYGETKIAEWGWRGTAIAGAELWCLTFAGADKYKVFFSRHSRKIISTLLERFPLLWCHVYIGHTKAIKWLLWLGFVTRGVRQIGDGQFYRMERRRWDS